MSPLTVALLEMGWDGIVDEGLDACLGQILLQCVTPGTEDGEDVEHTLLPIVHRRQLEQGMVHLLNQPAGHEPPLAVVSIEMAQLYIEHGIKAFGEVVSAVRVRPFKPRIQAQEPVPPCVDCGGEIVPAMGKDARWLAAYTAKKYGVPLCAACAQKRAEAAETGEEDKPAEEETGGAQDEEVL